MLLASTSRKQFGQSADGYGGTRMGPAPVACGRCGTGPIRDGARFCDVCGAPTATTPEPAEYKQVTVLFADVVRSMDMASTLEPERLREIMARSSIGRQLSCSGTAVPSTSSLATALWRCSGRRLR